MPLGAVRARGESARGTNGRRAATKEGGQKRARTKDKREPMHGADARNGAFREKKGRGAMI